MSRGFRYNNEFELFSDTVISVEELINVSSEFHCNDKPGVKDPNRQFTNLPFDYKFNSNGYRSPEFVADGDFLFAGCSCTLGEGVPVQYTWPRLFLNKLEADESHNITYANVGVSGASFSTIARIVQGVIANYTYKNVLVLCPSPTRTLHLVSEYATQTLWGLEVQPRNLTNAKLHWKEVEQWYCASTAVNLQYAFLTQLVSLQRFCELQGVNFYWTTWDQQYIKVLNAHALSSNNVVFKHYVPLKRELLLFQERGDPHTKHTFARDGVHPPLAFYEDVASCFYQHIYSCNEKESYVQLAKAHDI